jgi:hypothetical protein
MKIAFLLVIGIVCNNLYGQTETVFKVSARQEITIAPKMDTLTAGSQYKFVVLGIDPKLVSAAKFSGGKAWMKDSMLIIGTNIYLSPTKLYKLELFTDSNGQPKSIYQKMYSAQLIGYSSRTVFKSVAILPDSSWVLSNVNYFFKVSWGIPLSLTNTLSKAKLSHQPGVLSCSAYRGVSNIISFKMVFNCYGVVDSLASSSDALTTDMDKKIKNLKKGNQIVIKDVKFKPGLDTAINDAAGPYLITIK